MKIEIDKLCKQYKKSGKALSSVSMKIESPSLIGLLGPNGAGKSTLMKILVSRLIQTSGSIKVDGVPLRMEKNSLYGRLGYLPQDFGMYDELSVYDFLDYMTIIKNIKGSERRKEIEDVISKTGLEEKKTSKIRTLSGGQKQRVGIAQALLGNPEMMIFDEPTVGLDPEERIKFRNLFSKYASNKIVILSTHIIEDVQSVCGRLIVLNSGNVIFDGTPDELINIAVGHVGQFESADDNTPFGDENKKLKIISRIYTHEKVQFKIVGDSLPSYVESVIPSLEDAYMYLISKGEFQS